MPQAYAFVGATTAVLAGKRGRRAFAVLHTVKPICSSNPEIFLGVGLLL